MDSPERATTYAVCPDDRYNSLFLAFTTLKGRGYPVGLHPIPKREAQYHRAKFLEELSITLTPAGEEYRKAREERFEKWIRLTIHNAEFVKKCHPFWEPLELTTDDNVATTLEDHPGHLLVPAVDSGDTSAIANYKRRIEKGLVPYTKQKIDVAKMLPGIAFAAIQRKLTPGITPQSELLPHEEAVLQHYDHANKRDRRAYVGLRAQGVQPVSTEAMGALTEDYYRVVEELLPDFAVFATKPEPPPHSPVIDPNYVY